MLSYFSPSHCKNVYKSLPSLVSRMSALLQTASNRFDPVPITVYFVPKLWGVFLSCLTRYAPARCSASVTSYAESREVESSVQEARKIFPITITFTDIITPSSRVLLEKLTDSQLVEKSPSLYGTRRFITAFTSARHLP
jgi:hypothetical protein